ncbi:MAG: hypothetical protein ACTSVB_11835 [Candidatus Heimdallarchaeaceae archaeon]|nr:MAG: hypothetical protein DRN69_05770 [Candidatus Pacearchaeota archaeon]
MSKKPGIYYIVMFDWPEEVSSELSKKVREFHELVEKAPWIREIVAASGGIGIGATSIWIFWLQDYTDLNKLLRSEEEISKLYHEWTKEMQNVETMVREEVIFV